MKTSLRSFLLAACSLASAPALSQIPANVGSEAAKVLKDNNYLHGEIHDPLQPTGFPSPDAKDGYSFVDLGQSPDFQARHADSLKTVNNVLYLEGNCLFMVKGYRITSDSAIYDRNRNTATLAGHVQVDGDLFNVDHADSVTVNFNDNSFIAKYGTAQISPQVIQGSLRDKIYVKGKESYGTQKMITTLDGSVTTCDYPVPHYDIEARNIVLIPGRRVTFRKTKIRILGYVVAQLPFLSIPLDDRTVRNTPYVGQNDIEGTFVKATYGIPSKNPNYNILTHEDYMTKLGLGLGMDYSYLSHASAGTLSIYHVFGSTDDLTFASNHKQLFNWGSVSEQTDYEKDNYLVAPGTTQLNTKWTILVPQGTRATDQIVFTDASSSTSGFTSDSKSIALDDRRDYGNKIQSTLDVNYFSTSSAYAGTSTGLGGITTASGQKSQTLDVHLQAQKDFNAATAAIEFQKTIPIGTTPTFISSNDETPVLSLTSDARRLLGSKLGADIPFQTTLSWGDFQDPQSKSSISRGYFDFNFNKVDTSTSRFKVDFNGDFRQGIYSDNTAQYVLGLGTNVRYDLGDQTGINLRYNYLRPYGYSPLPIDETGTTNYISGDLNYRPIKPLLIGAQTGYDITRLQTKDIPWQQISLRTEYQPEKYFLLRGLYSYDTFAEKWQDVRLDLTYVPGATKLTIGADYDAEQHTWNTVNLYLDSFKWGNLKTSIALDYNGYLKMFDSEQFSFIYDLHCAEAVFVLQETNSGFNSGRQMQFFIRLKAIPFDVPFGAGTRGQPIGVGSGSSF